MPTTSKVIQRHPTIFKPLDPDGNEMYLFHGTNTRIALKIASEDVRLNLSKPGGGVGPGLYLSESVTKSDEYASDTSPGSDEVDPYYGGVFAMLVMRVDMGKMHLTDQFFTDTEKERVMDSVANKMYDSILADRRKATGTFREFCVFDKDQIYTEYVVFYERVYTDPTFGVPRMRSILGASTFQFQVPSYFVNFHKNPHTESFDEEVPLRPRGMDLLQHTLRIMSGKPELQLVRATRLEHSGMLCEYVNLKLWVKGRGVSNPGAAMKAVLSEDLFKSFASAAAKSFFSLDNTDRDVNEVYLWAGVAPTSDGQLHSIRAAAAAVRNCLTFFGNPRDALENTASTADGRKSLLLCRAVCGEIHQQESHTRSGHDTILVTATRPAAACHHYRPPCNYFMLRLGAAQIYPEMMAYICEKRIEKCQRLAQVGLA
jgi:hypothetical protein